MSESANNPPADGPQGGEERVVRDLRAFCRQLNWGATLLQLLTVLIALGGIVLSLLVATYTGTEGMDPGQLKVLAFLSAACTALYSGFRLRAKAADMRSAYRLLNADLMRHRIGALSVSQLIESYSKAEEVLGQVEVDGLAERSGPSQTPPA
ncbi:MAG: hypothetical protein ACK6AD_00845 [Cyanobacteriota bacterium]|jgi:hypothetical protein